MFQQPPATPPPDIGPVKNALSGQHAPPPLAVPGNGARFGATTPPKTGDRIDVFVELSTPSIAELYVRANADSGAGVTLRAITAAHLQEIDAAQRTLAEALAGPAIDAEILGNVRYVLNGIAIRVDASKLPQIRKLPGVAAVWPLRVGQYNAQPVGAAASDEMDIPGGANRPGDASAPHYPVNVPALE